MPPRTRGTTRKQAQARAREEKQNQPTDEEIQEAAAQENAEFQQSQLIYLRQRVAGLRVELNRAHAEIVVLKGKLELPTSE